MVGCLWLAHLLHTPALFAAQFRLYDHLFQVSAPVGDNWMDSLNPVSEVVVKGFVDPSVKGAALTHFQMERNAYFVIDKDSAPGNLVLNRVVTLRAAKGAKAVKSKGSKGNKGKK